MTNHDEPLQPYIGTHHDFYSKWDVPPPMTKDDKRAARKHAKRLLRDQIGLTRQTSPSKKKYKKLVNEFAVNIYKLNVKLQERKTNEQTGN